MLPSFLFAIALATTGVVGAPSPADVVAQLKAAPAQADRIKILDKDSDFVFSFCNATAVKGAGGETISATVTNFPVLVNNGSYTFRHSALSSQFMVHPCLSMTIGMLGPCGMNTPHSHSRATEIIYLVNGSVTTGMIPENDERFIVNKVEAGSAQVFLQGSIHYHQNELCDPIVFVAALSSEDPGLTSITQRQFGLPPDVVGAALGGLGVEYVAGLECMIPNNIALGRQECLDRCGIKRDLNQPTSQRQPRNSNNALPGMTSTTWPSSTTRQYQPYSATPTASKYTKTGNVAGAISEDNHTVATNGGISNSILIALAVVVGVLDVGYVVLAVVWLVRRRRNDAKKANRFYVRPEMSSRSIIPTEEPKYDTPQ